MKKLRWEWLVGGLFAAYFLIQQLRKKNAVEVVSLNASIPSTSELIADNYNRTNGKRIDYTGKAVSHNNPGNLRWFGADWQGLDKNRTKKNDFCFFTSRDYGTRAQCKLLLNYLKEGNNTITKIATKWAPAADGNVPLIYANFLAKNSGVSSTAILSAMDVPTLAKIAYYQHIIEAGFAWIDYAKYVEWLTALQK